MSDLSLASETIMLDDRIRGFPTGHAPAALADIGALGWKPYDGLMSLPLISLDRAAFARNIQAMMGYVRSHGIANPSLPAERHGVEQPRDCGGNPVASMENTEGDR